MQEKRLWLLFILVSFSVSAQIKGVVVDENNKPIPFVNIWVENENIGTTSEEDGTFNINTTEKSQNLILSSLGYETKKTPISQATIIVLKSKVITLDEVVISKPKNTKEIEIGDLKKAFYLPEPQAIPWIFAKKVDIDKENPDAIYIKNITFLTHSEVEGAVFRVRVFSVNSQNMPDEDILTNEVIVVTQKGRKKVTVDVSMYKLKVPTEGVIVGFESLFLEQNKYIQETNKEDVTFMNYDPHIYYQYINIEESYTFKLGRWIKQSFKNHYQKGKQNRVIAPVLTVTLNN